MSLFSAGIRKVGSIVKANAKGTAKFAAVGAATVVGGPGAGAAIAGALYAPKVKPEADADPGRLTAPMEPPASPVRSSIIPRTAPIAAIEPPVYAAGARPARASVKPPRYEVASRVPTAGAPAAQGTGGLSPAVVLGGVSFLLALIGIVAFRGRR